MRRESVVVVAAMRGRLCSRFAKAWVKEIRSSTTSWE